MVNWSLSWLPNGCVLVLSATAHRQSKNLCCERYAYLFGVLSLLSWAEVDDDISEYTKRNTISQSPGQIERQPLQQHTSFVRVNTSQNEKNLGPNFQPKASSVTTNKRIYTFKLPSANKKCWHTRLAKLIDWAETWRAQSASRGWSGAIRSLTVKISSILTSENIKRFNNHFGRNIAKKVSNQVAYFIFPPHLTSVYALPGETKKPIAYFNLNAKCCLLTDIKHIYAITWSWPNHSLFAQESAVCTE